MADTLLPEFTVTGVPIFGNPFDQDAAPGFIGGGLSLNELATAQESQYPGATPEPDEAFAPPPPVLPPKLLPEVIVEAPSLLGTILTGLTALLFPQPMGPREFDEAPGGGGTAPPPSTPVGEDPIMPPNWDDLGQGGDESLLDPIRPPGLPIPEVEMPPGEKYFDVSPPKVTKPSNPISPLWLEPIFPEFDPYGSPTYSPDIGPGPAPAPIRTPGVDPVPGLPDLFPDIRIDTAPRPASPGAPDLFGAPLPDIVGNPFGDPITASPLPNPTRPDTRAPASPTIPDFFGDFSTPKLTPDPLLVEFGPQPVGPEKDTCSCAKKKPPKKRKPRDVCYRGTYVQHSRGISYKRLEEVPCDSKPVSKRETVKKPKLKPGQFPGLGFNSSDAIDLGAHIVDQFAPILMDYLKDRAPKPAKKSKRNRKAKTKPGRVPGTIYTSPFPNLGD